MTTPQLLTDLAQMLLDLAVPAATCTLVLAGVALRREGGMNFEAGGGFQKWILWSVILLTVPQILRWFSGQGFLVPAGSGSVTTSWLSGMESSFKNFVTDVVVARLIPLLAAFFVLKATLDLAQGHEALGSVIAAIFLLTVTGTVKLLQGFNTQSQFATTDMLASLWNYVAGTILPEAAGLAVVGAVLRYARQKPMMPLVATALAFLSVSGLWKLVQAMVG